MVSKTRQPKPDLLTEATPPAAADGLAGVAVCDDVVEYTLRCVLAMAPRLNEAVMRQAEAQVRARFGGSRVYVGRRHGDGTASRNEAIRRDFALGEQMGLLQRRYGLSRVHLWRIINNVSSH